MSSHLHTALTALLVLAATATPPFGARGALAQTQGTITGEVVEARSGRPLAQGQVFILGTGVGGLTNTAGRYLLANVPTGTVTVRVELIGYTSTEQTVDVPEGGAVAVDFELSEEALALDEIVVTGTPGGTQRRAIGNVVGRVSAARVMEATPSFTFQELLGTRVPGVSLGGLPGGVGGIGAPIRIRGVSSLSLPNDPLIYVDGVRINSNRDTGLSSKSPISRLNDINPEDIESIEVIKGPAAATLYGTEASNGVIQIITKKGRTGAPVLDVTVKSGTLWMPDPAGKLGMTYFRDNQTGEMLGHNLYEWERDNGQGDVFQNGRLTNYTVNLRGGTDLVRYNVSADWTDNEGILDYNTHEKFGSRVNLGVFPHPTLDLNSGFAYIRSNTRLGQVNPVRDILGSLHWGSPSTRDQRLRGFFAAPPEEMATVEALSGLDRFTWNLQATHRPWSWFTQRLITGVDYAAEVSSVLYPRHPDGTGHFFGAQSLGQKNVDEHATTFITIDYSATATVGLTDNLESALSIGVQHYRNEDQISGSSGKLFPTPAVTTVSGAAITTGSEDFIENRTLGMYVQEQLSWKGRLFFTAAVRADDNSAFGANFDIVTYPKVSASWVLNEEPFWNVESVSSLRLRAAWGATGQQPDVFAAVRLYDPSTGPGDQSVVTPGAIGNPDLKPEKGQERELGFDAGLFEDQVLIDFTYYTRKTLDAIVSKALPPSSGFPGFQFINVGEVKNWGAELGVYARLLEGRQLGWDVGLTFATTKSRVEDLGEGVESISIGGTRQHRVGEPLSSYYFKRVVSAEFISGTRGSVQNEMCEVPDSAPVPCAEAPRVRWGQPTPTWDLGVNTTLTLFGNLRLYARVEARGGHLHEDSTWPGAHTSVQTTLAGNLQDEPIFMAYRKIGRNPLGFYNAGFAKLRELSATYTLPTGLASSVGASRVVLSVAARNVFTLWIEEEFTRFGPQRIWDPETTGEGEFLANHQAVMPPTSQILATVRLTF